MVPLSSVLNPRESASALILLRFSLIFDRFVPIAVAFSDTLELSVSRSDWSAFSARADCAAAISVLFFAISVLFFAISVLFWSMAALLASTFSFVAVSAAFRSAVSLFRSVCSALPEIVACCASTVLVTARIPDWLLSMAVLFCWMAAVFAATCSFIVAALPPPHCWYEN